MLHGMTWKGWRSPPPPSSACYELGSCVRHQFPGIHSRIQKFFFKKDFQGSLESLEDYEITI